MDIQQLIAEGKSYLFLLPIYVILLSSERIFHELTQERKWNDADGATNIVITVAHLVRDLFLGAVLPVAALMLIYENFRIFALPHTAVGLVAAWLLYDFCWYIDHRIAHRTGLFWANHHPHHSSREFNMTVASRGFILDGMLITRPLFLLLPVVGVSPMQYITVVILTSIWGIAQHTRLFPKVSWLDAVFATPSNHRVHHGSDQKYIDRNYGEVLIIWDKLFGTYQREEEEPCYGLTTNISTYNPLRIEAAGYVWLIERVRSAERLSDKLRYLIKPPEWRHREIQSTVDKGEALVCDPR